MATITEISPDIFRISTFIPDANLQFNQFLVRDDEPLLFHTGLKKLFPVVRDAVATLVDPASLRWIGFSHYEADECGALADWQTLAPNATAVCSIVAKVVSVDDVAVRPARALNDGEVLVTGKHRLRFLQTPHVPHAWDAGLMFDETSGTFFCSDILLQNGDVGAVTESDVVGPARDSLIHYQKGPLADSMLCTPFTERILERLAALKPKTLAIMHGATYIGDGERAIRGLMQAMREVLGEPAAVSRAC